MNTDSDVNVCYGVVSFKVRSSYFLHVPVKLFIYLRNKKIDFLVHVLGEGGLELKTWEEFTM